MPGSGNLLRIEFPNGTPRPAIFVFLLLFANFAASFAVDQWVEHYAPRQPSASCPFPVNLKLGVVAFVPSWLGRYEDWGFCLHFAFLGLCFLIVGWYAIKGQAVFHTRTRSQR
jgi:hypothetical protein